MQPPQKPSVWDRAWKVSRFVHWAYIVPAKILLFALQTVLRLLQIIGQAASAVLQALVKALASKIPFLRWVVFGVEFIIATGAWVTLWHYLPSLIDSLQRILWG
jgi:hypothetical protein